MIIGVEITRKELCSDTSSILYKPLVMYKNREFSRYSIRLGDNFLSPDHKAARV